MSFFAIEPRQFNSPSKNQPNTAPGCYQFDKNLKSNGNQNYAPFGSLQKKKNKLKPSNSLGPGQYQIRSQICKPSITKYQSNHCVIIKINEEGWSQFKSKSDRFNQTLNKSSYTPGPGEYQPERVRYKTQSKQKNKSSIGQKIKQMNLKNYVQRRKPTLFSDPVDINKGQISRNPKYKGSNWSLNKQQRFSPLKKQSFHQEHKQQLIQKIKDDKKKSRSKSQSAVFASKSLKSHLEAEIYQTNNPFKVQLRKMVNYKDERPGPGSYNSHDLQYKNKLRFNRHQFFGSTVERFSDSQKKSISIGPGYYSPKYDAQKKNSESKNFQNQYIQQNRHSYIPLNTTDVGPGSYSVDSKKKHKSSCKWVFASKNPRFSEQTTIQQNGEQILDQELQNKMKRQKQIDYRKQFLKDRNQANFASTTKRFEQDKKSSFQNVPVGFYNVSQTDIGQRIKNIMKKEKDVGRYQNHTENPPFLSSVERFQNFHDKQQQNIHHDCWCLVKSVEKQVYEHQSSAFTSKQKRTVVFQNNHAKFTPAVGSYTRQASFIKSSFNSRFIKANQSRSKKLKIWNTQKNKFMSKKPNFSQKEDQIIMIKVN